ncbi:anti-sigma-K factor RskA [Gemmobacter caeni]|uniref:Anti-sigma-K factor RskA n=1 Tax=Gemmobacter caeni TaxID=589035 RepID=A0A2T6A7G3_9RHOB|nr:anti-sigma factor [Gemmobacter caeni]PTX39747.1 anti-sigma-K factor RskA [Gemmobacter caeni]TWI89848.1 anti-sigma-K factor RskA [Gemmobacter caeni]
MTQRPLPDLIDDVVMGLADAADVARLQSLASRDPAIADALERTRQKFSPLDATADTLPLPEGFWARIEAGIVQGVDPEATSAPEAIPQSAAAAIDLDTARGRIRRWQISALTGIAASMALAAVLGWSLLSQPAPAVMAVLLNSDGAAVALIESMADNTTRVILLERPDVPSDQVMQVWTKPDDSGPPVSLGLLETGRSQTLHLEGFPAPHALQLYEITAEPARGSPTNLPTGPILGKGLAKVPIH